MLAEGATKPAVDPMAPKPPHYQAQGQIGHLAVHGRRPQPYRPLRSEAEAERTAGPAAAGFLRQIDHGDGHRQQLADGLAAQWKQYGQSGTWVSDWYPNIAQHVDDMAVIRSCWADGLNHVGSVAR